MYLKTVKKNKSWNYLATFKKCTEKLGIRQFHFIQLDEFNKDDTVD